MATKDFYGNARGVTTSPGDEWFEITPSDATDLPQVVRALYVGGTGDVKVNDVNGNAATFVGLPTGIILPIRAYRIMATGTTATNLVGLV